MYKKIKRLFLTEQVDYIIIQQHQKIPQVKMIVIPIIIVGDKIIGSNNNNRIPIKYRLLRQRTRKALLHKKKSILLST